MHLKYKHDNSGESGDEFRLMITDGVHKVEQISHVKVMPLKDEQPQVTKNAGLKVNIIMRIFHEYVLQKLILPKIYT